MRFFLLVMPILLSACATSFDDAVSVKKLGENMYLVHSAGNTETSQQRISEYAFLGAAMVCKTNGFSYFTKSDDKRASEEHTNYVPPVTSCYTGYGGSMICSTSGGSFWTSNSHSETMVVSFLNRSEAAEKAAFDCDLIYKQFAPQYLNE